MMKLTTLLQRHLTSSLPLTITCQETKPNIHNLESILISTLFDRATPQPPQPHIIPVVNPSIDSLLHPGTPPPSTLHSGTQSNHPAFLILWTPRYQTPHVEVRSDILLLFSQVVVFLALRATVRKTLRATSPSSS